MEIFLVSENGVISEVSRENDTIKSNKKKKELVHKGYNKKGDLITMVDFDKTLVKPVAKNLLKNQLHRERKMALMAGGFAFAFFCSLMWGATKQGQTNQPPVIQNQNNGIVSLVPEEKKEDQKIDERAQSLNLEMMEDIKIFKTENEKLKQDILLDKSIISQLQQEKQLFNSQCSLEKKEIEIQVKQSQRPEILIYKEIENNFKREKEKEFREIAKLKYLSDAQRACKNYFDKNIKNAQDTVNNG